MTYVGNNAGGVGFCVFCAIVLIATAYGTVSVVATQHGLHDPSALAPLLFDIPVLHYFGVRNVSKIELIGDTIRWTYLLRRGGEAPIADILSVTSRGLGRTSDIVLRDQRRIRCDAGFAYPRLAAAIRDRNPAALIDVPSLN